MKLTKTFVYKLRPTNKQELQLAETLETCRRLYNRALSERKDTWEQEKRTVTFIGQTAALPKQKLENEYLARANAHVIQNVLRRVDNSFQNFFRRCKAGEKPGYPRFKGRNWYDSFCYPQWGNGTGFRNRRLALSKIGHLKVYTDRQIEGKPKTCTITRRVDGWYAQIVCEVEPQTLPETREDVGIDLGIADFATLSNGEHVANPKYYQRSERALKKAQRKLSRRKIGSQRRRKARVLLAKAHLKVKRARLDFFHKTALALVRRFDVIHVEKLDIKGMLKEHPFAKAISDAGWGLFLKVLRDKAAKAGRTVVEVDPAYTSQACSGCSNLVPKKLAQRWHSCPYCGLELGRDHNAALNIIKKGQGMAFGELSALAGA